MEESKGSIRRVLIIGEDRHAWYAPAWQEGLCKLGIEAIQLSYTNMWSRGVGGWLEQRLMWGPSIVRINYKAIESVIELKPDVTLLYAALPLWPSTVRTLANRTWVTTYCNDDPFGAFGRKAYFRHFRCSLPHAHSHHVYRAVNVQDYQRLGVSRVAVLCSYFIPWLDRPQVLSASDRIRFGHDVVYIGHAEADPRIEYTRALVQAGIPLKIFGSDKYWRRFLPRDIHNRLSPIVEVYDIDYRKVIAASKICLVFLSRGNRDQYTRRVFEIPAVGGFMACERTPMMQELYEEDKEAVYFSSADELVDKCRYYLRNETARQKIAQAGHQRCLRSGYDIVSRMRQWRADIQRWMGEAD